MRAVSLIGLMVICGTAIHADDPVHSRIDQIIEAAAGSDVAPAADDAEFLRRVYLDLVGRIPSLVEARSFLSDQTGDRRTVLIDRLLASPEYPRRMRDIWNVQLMERAGEHEEWLKFLEVSFSENKPWDQLVREMLNPNAEDEKIRGAAYFLSKRLENYGQQPVDLPGLTRDVGRLLLGVDLQCAQCHDHLFIQDYKQIDFQGLHTFLSHTTIRTDVKFPAIAEKVVDKKTEFMSVFLKEPRSTGPRLPFGTEFAVPSFDKGQEFAVSPDRKTNFPGKPKFSPLAILAEQLPVPTNPLFVRNIVNRLWWQMMGHGLVYPLDLTHSDNPPSHPKVVELLAQEFVAHHFDVKWMLRELALTRAYQRSSVVPARLGAAPLRESYLVAIEKPLSPEQMLLSVLQATGELAGRETASQLEFLKPNPQFVEMRKLFLAAFANPPRDPEGDFAPSVKAALFLSNEGRVLELLKPRNTNLAAQLLSEPDVSKQTEHLFLSVLSRLPTSEESLEVSKHLGDRPDEKGKKIGQVIWALICSTEFCVNH